MMRFTSLPAVPGDPTHTLTQFDPEHVEPREIENILQLDEFLEMCAHPADIEEFQVFAPLIGHHRGRVCLAPDIEEFGLCFTADIFEELEDHDISWIVALRPSSDPGALPLLDLFAHELAHVFSGEEGHNFVFLCALNALRCSVGLGPSFDPYDIRDGFHLTQLGRDSLISEEDAANWCAEIGGLLASAPNFPNDLASHLVLVHGTISRAEEIRSSDDLFDLVKTLKSSFSAADVANRERVRL